MQKPERDLSSALKHADDIISVLRSLLESGKEEQMTRVQKFADLFKRAISLVKEHSDTNFCSHAQLRLTSFMTVEYRKQLLRPNTHFGIGIEMAKLERNRETRNNYSCFKYL